MHQTASDACNRRRDPYTTGRIRPTIEQLPAWTENNPGFVLEVSRCRPRGAVARAL